MLASLIVRLEENPYPKQLTRTTPLFATLQCVAAYAPDIPSAMRDIIQASLSSDKALKALEEALSSDPLMGSLIGTTQAIDLVGGGVKTNALPERAWAVINHRISVDRYVTSKARLECT